MKTNAIRNIRNTFLALAIAATGHAQSAGTLRADVPFNFVAGKVTLTAGTYTVEQNKAGFISVRAANGKGAFLLVTDAQCGRGQIPPRLVFQRYGDTYLLSQVWTIGDNCVRQVPQPPEATAKPRGEAIVAMH